MGKFRWRGRTLWIDYRADGKRYREKIASRLSDSTSEISRVERLGFLALAKRSVQVVEDTFFDIKNRNLYRPKFWRLVGRYWRYHLSKQNSGQMERSKLNILLKDFGTRYADEIQREDITDWMGDCLERETVRGGPMGINTINRRFAYLRATFNYALTETDKRRIFRHNPTAHIAPLAGADPRGMLIEFDEFEKGYKAARAHFKPIWLAGWETGCRPEELYGLSWSMVDMIGRVLRLPARLTKTKNGRCVPISKRLLSQLISLPHAGEWVFPSISGSKYWDPSDDIKPVREAIGKPVWFRDLRGSFVTHRLDAGWDYARIMIYTGHRSVQALLPYCRDTLRRAIRGADDAVVTRRSQAV